MKKRNMIFWIVLVFAILFVFSPLFLRISFVEHFLLWFLKPLKDSDYKSSYIETVGAIIGTILAITGTLLLQGMIDKKEKLEKEEQKQKEIQYKIVIIYYDLKLALLDIAKIYNLLVLSAFLVNIYFDQQNANIILSELSSCLRRLLAIPILAFDAVVVCPEDLKIAYQHILKADFVLDEEEEELFKICKGGS